MSKNSKCTDEDGRRYKKSQLCKCCNGPTSLQASEDSSGDDYDLNPDEWQEWMKVHFPTNENALLGSDSDESRNTNVVVTENTEDNSASTTLIRTTTNPDTPDVLLPVSHVASADPSMSTTSVSTTSTSSPYYSSEFKKRNFQKLCR